MSSTSRQIRSTAVAMASSKKAKSRRLSTSSDEDSQTARPTKRARKSDTTDAGESQTTLVAEKVSSMKIKAGSSVVGESQTTAVEEAKETKKGVRRKKNAAEPTPGDFPPRVSREWKVGAHISAAGGIEQAITNAAKIGAEAFALFMKNQRQWAAKPLEPASISAFKARMETFGYDYNHIIPHGSYLVNLANPDKEKRQKSYDCFLDDLLRCEQLGINLYNFHPGSTVGGCSIEESIKHLADCLNRAHKATSSVVTVVENMAGAGNVLGCSFEQLAQIIDLIEDKKRVGICLDTCHLFASGYDIRTREAYEATMAAFGDRVGYQYLRGFHLNDSKTDLGSKRDRHEHLGLGFIGLRAFGFLMRDERLKNLPMVLETPTEEVWPKEIEVLQRMANPEVQDEDLDFEAMTDEIKTEAKKYEKEKKPKEKTKEKATVKKTKKTKKNEQSDSDREED